MDHIGHIKKRNGTIVEFEPIKIEEAVKKAFLAVKGDEHAAIAKLISTLVTEELMPLFSANEIPTVEQTQDLVEKHLMYSGHLDVAKAYIIYRYEHQKQRTERKAEDLEKVEKNKLYVVKRDGRKEVFSSEKLKKSLQYAVVGYEREVNVDAVVEQCKIELYDGMPTSEVARSLLMVTRSLIEQDPAYSFVASRLLLRQLYREVIGDDVFDFGQFDQQYRDAFIRGIKYGVKIQRFDKRLAEFDLKKLSKALKPERDEMFRYLGTQTLYDRYYTRDVENGNRVIEIPQGFWMRVAMGLSLNEKDKEARAIEFYEMLSTLRFVPSTPTLFHSGTNHPQLSSCYLNTVSDSLDHIFKVYADNAQLSKWSGGIGTDWTNVRATGALIKGTGVQSNGIIPFLKIANDVTVAINRSGRRRGATCVYLENWHMDIEEFLELRKNTGDERRRTHDMNTALWVSDLFMKRVRDDADWTLFSPDECPELHETYGSTFEEHYTRYEALAKEGKLRTFRTMKARDLWKKMINMLYETGHPWITFKDPSNIRSPQDHVGVVHNSNLCTEITLNNSPEETAVCNLGSVNFAVHVRDGKFDQAMVTETVKVAMRMLDNVIDVNFYPTKEAENSNMRHRPVGLGIMGFHDALYQLGINFDSEEAMDFADESMEVVAYAAIMSSSLLAKERGTYSSYKGSKWDRNIFPQDTIDLLEKERGERIEISRGGKLDWTPVREHVAKYGMRNSNTMAIAPTATISNIAGSIPAIEPIYKNIYVKANQSGDFTVINPYLVEDLKKAGLWDFHMIGKLKYHDGSIQRIPEIPANLKAKYKETFEISPEWLIKAAARRGKWIDQSQSLNIFYAGTSGREISGVYEYAWRMGLKTTYYLRTLGASQVEKSTVSATEFGSTHKRDLSRFGSETTMSGAATIMIDETVRESVLSPLQPESIAMEVVERQSIEIIRPEIHAMEQQVPKMQSGIVLDPKETSEEPKLCKILDPDCEACQ
jgi:ribonucleoside-diphosphate reductase alpha chain